MHPSPLVQKFYLPMIVKLLDQYVSINLSLANEKVDVIHDDYDIMLRTERLESAAYIARQLCNIEMVFCASPAYLEKQHAQAYRVTASSPVSDL